MSQPAGGDQDRARRADALIARMKAARGYSYPEWELAARQDPEFVESYHRIYALGLGEGRHVSAKVREFVAIALLAFRGSDRAGLGAHMERAQVLVKPKTLDQARARSRAARQVGLYRP